VLATLYRYPHPHDATRFIYCGQGRKRDREHRSGGSSFGRRFKRDFPEVELPQPIRQEVEVKDQLELNELETIWMFQYHTWCGHPGGMNLIMPGAQDYKTVGRIGASTSGRKNAESGHIQALGRKYGPVNGRIQGRAAVESGRCARMGKISGRKAVESGHLASISTFENRSKGGRKNVESGHLARLNQMLAESGHVAASLGGRTSNCLRWNIRRSKPCVCGRHHQKAA
jgi:hypothetical protein